MSESAVLNPVGSMSQADHAKSQKYEMPPAYIGMPVLWYQDGNRKSQPYAGTVVALGFRSVEIMFMALGSPRCHERNGVRHVDDPDTKDIERGNSGLWDYTEETHQLRRLAAFVQKKLNRGEPA